MPDRDAAHVVWIESAAPTKPEPGAACNGCGLCCAWQPCPLGMMVSRRRHGRCAALAWQPAEARYHCTMLTDPGRHWPWLPGWARPMVARLSRRWIAAGVGCDFDAEAQADTHPSDRSHRPSG